MPVNPLIGASLLQGGGGILGGLADLIGGGAQRKRSKQLFQQGQSLFGQEPFDPQQVSQFAFRGALPQLRGLGGRVNRQLGLDAGVGQGEMLKNIFEAQQGIFSDTFKQGKLARFNRDASLLGLLGQLNQQT